MRIPRARVTRSRLTPSPVDVDAKRAPAKAPTKKRAARATLSAEALEELGAEKLVGILMSLAENDAAVARSLRLVLAGHDGAGRLAAEIEKRLRTLQRASGFVAWDKVRPLSDELDGLRQIIAGDLAKFDPYASVTQMRLLLSLHEGILERSDDSSGSLGGVFDDAASDLGSLWALVPSRDSVALARELLGILDADGYGVTGSLLDASRDALGQEGRAELRRLLEARLAALPDEGRQADYDRRGRFTTSMQLRQLADLEGSVDGYIAAAQASGRPESFANEIAQRLTASGRPAEALAWLDRADAWQDGRHRAMATPNADLRIAALEALGRADEAQQLRLKVFEQLLSVAHLRAYLKRLPDFDDVEAEDRAIARALEDPRRDLALGFLVDWPNLAAANQLVRAHHADLNGGNYLQLRPAAEALTEKYPLAATLLHRALAEDVLRRASSRQYQYAARDVRACVGLAPFLPAEDGAEPHMAFMTRLRQEHPRKAAFWALLSVTEGV